jgi:pimeloyl-ACP methyl ester carboxylesterase
MAMTSSQYLTRPDGRIAYEVAGSGSPLVICVPGMGELRQSYRHVTPELTRYGCRVATVDLRGHGDSDATFGDHDDVALAGDLLALIDELGGPAVVVGNSMAAGAAVIAAADRPEAVSGLALLGPFVRDPRQNPIERLMFRLLLTRPWGPAAFMSYYPKMMPGPRPEDYATHRDRVRESLRRPGHWDALVRASRTSHAPAEQRLDAVRCPAVVIMGDADPDWRDPAAEARWVGDRLRAEVVVLPGVGHYPQAQAPAATASAVTRLVDQASHA